MTRRLAITQPARQSHPDRWSLQCVTVNNHALDGHRAVSQCAHEHDGHHAYDLPRAQSRWPSSCASGMPSGKLSGNSHGRDAAFDYDKMMASFEPAAAAYEEAATIARSDPLVHEAECELWTQILAASDVRPNRLRPSFDKAKIACENAIAADPARVTARLKLLLAQYLFAWNARNGLEKEDPEAIIQAAITQADELSKRWVNDAMAQYLVGGAHRTAVVYLMNRGLDAQASLERAISAYERSIEIDPTFAWPYNEVCASYGERTRSEIARGIDPSGSVDRAVVLCDLASGLDPSFTLPAISKAFAYVQKADYLLQKGQSPEAAVTLAFDTATAVKDKIPIDAARMAAWALFYQARYELESGKDPESTLSRTEALLLEKEKLESPPSDEELTGLVANVRATYRLKKGEAPTSETENARKLFQKLIASSPWDIDYRIDLARTELIDLTWRHTHGKIEDAEFDIASAPLLPLLDKERAIPHFYNTLAEIHVLHAEHLLKQKRDAVGELQKGRTMVEKALLLNSSSAPAIATKAHLSSLEAQ